MTILGELLKALLDWITGFITKKAKEDTHAKDATPVPSHIRERFDARVREHEGGIRGHKRRPPPRRSRRKR